MTANQIPENYQDILIEENTSRFSDAIWYEEVKKKVIMLAGVGGIGSYVGFLLSRLQPTSLFIYDPDVVEVANMSGQLYGSSNIGRFKTDALADFIKEFSLYESVFSVSEPYTSEDSSSDIMICGFDNMSARKTFFNNWKVGVESKENPEDRKKCLFIDGRLAAEEFQVFCIRGDDSYNIDRYEREFLFEDSEAEETICSYKQTTFMANMIGSVIVNLFVNFVANECSSIIIRDLPFLTTYNANLMFFKTVA